MRISKLETFTPFLRSGKVRNPWENMNRNRHLWAKNPFARLTRLVVVIFAFVAILPAAMADDGKSGKEVVASCESACTETCKPWNVPKCVANCVATGKPDCATDPDPESCTGECGSKCPPWKSPSKYANCLVSCADTGHWACYSDDEAFPLPLPKPCNDTISDWEEITREIALGEQPSDKQLLEATQAMKACFHALLGGVPTAGCATE